MNINLKLGRVLSGVLAASTIMTSFAGAGFDSGFLYSYPIAEGTTYSRSEGRNDAGVQAANIITYAPNSTVTPIISYTGDTLYGSSASIMNAASYAAKQGLSVVGGVNADFFVMSTGVPIGLVIDKGELISSDAWQYAVGFQADGSTVLGQPTMSMHVTGASGSATVSYFNKTRTTAGLYLLDSNFDSSSHFSANGKSIIFERVDDTPVTVNGSVKMRVVNKGSGNSSITITDKQLVLTQSDGAAGTWVDFAIGEEVTLDVYAADSSWANVNYAVGGKLLVQNSTPNVSGIDAGSSVTARTAVGTKPDGSLVIYEVDGLQSSSKGLTATQLANEMISLGCTTAVCLDGGGSSAMVMSKPGTSEVSLISSPSGGSQRACANYIFLASRAVPTGTTAHAVLTPTYRYLLPNGQTSFTVTGADSAYQSAPAPTDLEYTINDNLGTVTDSTFVAGEKTGNATIRATNANGVDGYMMVSISSAVNTIQLQNDGKNISSISLAAGQSMNVDALAYHLGQLMGATNRSFTWALSDNKLGTLDSEGNFIAGDASLSGTLTCSYGVVSTTIPVTVGVVNPQDVTLVTDFESDASFTVSDLDGAYITDTSAVARGKKSYRIKGEAASGTLMLPDTSVSGMQFVSLYARANTTGTLSAVFSTDSGEAVTAPFVAAPTSTYRLLNCTVPSDAKALTGIRFETSGGAHELDLDHIVLSAHHAITNTSAPSISLNKSALTVEAGASATLSGVALMEDGSYPIREKNISVSMDGSPVNATVTRSGANFTVTTGTLAQGVHVVTITALDDAGNRAQTNATITAGSASSVFADTNGHWATGYATLLNSKGIMQGETTGDKVYFRPARNLTRMEFAVIMARSLGLDTSYSGELDFADDASIPDWARGSVYAVSKASVMNGSKSGNQLYFNPRKEITRAEVMTVIARTLPQGYQGASISFTDANSIPSWASDAVTQCVQAGIVSGYENGSMKPLSSITRAEIAKILCVV